MQKLFFNSSTPNALVSTSLNYIRTLVYTSQNKFSNSFVAVSQNILMVKLFLFFILFFVCNFSFAQKITPQEYIETYKNAAIEEMKRSGIPASVTLSQGILETESGNSELVKKSNNHFGIKCKSTWQGESVTHTDDAPNECFRKYPSAAESYKDHSEYLKTSARYAALFQLEKGDYKGWAYGLKRAGYATNPRYPQIVISNIEKYNLQQYDQENYIPQDIANAETTKDIAVMQPSKLPDAKSVKNAINAISKFNGLKAMYATKGTSLLAIATAVNIDLIKVLEFNDLETDGILQEDQTIYLERKPKQGNRDFYTAIANESMYDIAQNNGVQLKYLLQFNDLLQNEIIPKGTKIKLRSIAQLSSNSSSK